MKNIQHPIRSVMASTQPEDIFTQSRLNRRRRPKKATSALRDSTNCPGKENVPVYQNTVIKGKRNTSQSGAENCFDLGNAFIRKSARFKGLFTNENSNTHGQTKVLGRRKRSKEINSSSNVLLHTQNSHSQNGPFDPLVGPSSEDVDYTDKYFDFDAHAEVLGSSDDSADAEDVDDVTNDNSSRDSESLSKRLGNSLPLKLDYIDEGDPEHVCNHCGAIFWYGERVKKDKKKRKNLSFSMCCQHGKVVLPLMKEPPPMLNMLFYDKSSSLSRNFYKNIRKYNNMFAFTSMGGKLRDVNSRGRGPYSYILEGMNYHSIGSLLPPEGSRPFFSQLYIFDTANEVANRIHAVSQRSGKTKVDKKIVEMIKHTLDYVNPYVKQYRAASSILSSSSHPKLTLRLISNRQRDGRMFNLPTAPEVAALIVGDLDLSYNVRDIVVHHRSTGPQRLNELHPSYLPLQYPLLFPYGEDGYRDDVPHTMTENSKSKRLRMVSMREFFAFRLVDRRNEQSTILHSEALLQQFIVDGYTMLEAQRLRWVRTHQNELRVDLYQGLSEAVLRGETDPTSTGKRVILPSSFTGGARYMLQNYQDAMAICRWAGYPDLFLTFTCNPNWPEITRHLDAMKLKPSCRPEILSRVFRMKLHTLMRTIKEEKIFGTVRAEVYTIEFQKRGLPHAHILLFLEPNDKITTNEKIDEFISAEIPDPVKEPRLYQLVQKHMTHGPCGAGHTLSPCMKDGECSKFYPKNFCSHTSMDDEGFPTYRRRDDGRVIDVQGTMLDNRSIVPYNSYLLQRFEAHINIEKCNQSTAIKYLFKYVSKGHDRVVAGIFDNSGNKGGKELLDEVQQYYNCRYISSCEGSWRIFGFEIHHRYPHVERLSFHLPNHQVVFYSANTDVSELLDQPRVCESQFLAWMAMNAESEFARTLTYQEFPQHFIYQRPTRKWKLRKRGKAIGRISHVSPSAGEAYYLRILLTKIKGPMSFEDIRTVEGKIHKSFREACSARGLLDDDNEFVAAIKEGYSWSTGHSLRRLFVSMLLCCCIQRPEHIWEKCKTELSDDLLHISRNHPHFSAHVVTGIEKEQAALRAIDAILRENGKCLQDYHSLPQLEDISLPDVGNRLIMQELSYDRGALEQESTRVSCNLNSDQRNVFDRIMEKLVLNEGGFFFVHGYGGTGKTYLWNALASTLRSMGDIVITVASSGIAATLLPSGRTAHSRFAIPIHANEFSVCSIGQMSPLADLLRATKLIIWDEAPMVQRLCIEALDRTLRDIMHRNIPFGGKCVVMGGDFRQILPVVPKGSRPTIIDACINSSPLWDHCQVFNLTQNMRLKCSQTVEDRERLRWFSQWLLDVGDGKNGIGFDGKASLTIPSTLLVTSTDNPLDALVKTTYHALADNLDSNEYFNDRAILAPTLEVVNKINNHVLSNLSNEEITYFSCDSICKSTDDIDSFEELYTTEFLNSINCSGMPHHKLSLKVGAPIMLVRNIDQSAGLCNGTRLRVTRLGKSVIEAITLNGSHPNERVLIHRMDMNPSDTRWPFKMQRRQFPVILSFAMSINKSQGQSLQHVGVHLSKPVFTHGQLYVAFSRVKSVDGLKIYIPGNEEGKDNCTTNVVYKEVFRNIYNA